MLLIALRFLQRSNDDAAHCGSHVAAKFGQEIKYSEITGDLQDKIRDLLQADRTSKNHTCFRLTSGFFVDMRVRL